MSCDSRHLQLLVVSPSFVRTYGRSRYLCVLLSPPMRRGERDGQGLFVPFGQGWQRATTDSRAQVNTRWAGSISFLEDERIRLNHCRICSCWQGWVGYSFPPLRAGKQLSLDNFIASSHLSVDRLVCPPLPAPRLTSDIWIENSHLSEVHP